MSPAADPDDVDRRFEELVSQEFPRDRPTSMGARRRRRREDAIGDTTERAEPVTEFDRWDAADEAEWERGDNRFRPDPLPPGRRWSATTRLGAVLMVLSAGLSLLIAFGVPFPGWVDTVAMVAFVVGLAVLLWRLVTNAHAGLNRRDYPDDGARR